MYKRLRYKYYMWRLARYIRKLQPAQPFNTTLTVTHDYDKYELSRATQFAVCSDYGGYAVLTLTQSLIDEYPSWAWLRLHAENVFHALNDWHREHYYPHHDTVFRSV